jgi:UDP-N-acetylmuramate dehydrogenase
LSFLTGLEHCVRSDEPLAPHTWFKLGGPAEYFAEPTHLDDLATIVRRCRDDGRPVRLLGGGSNVLVREEGVKGVVVQLSAPAFGHIEAKGRTVAAGGGARLAHVISTSVREGLAGLETLVGMPGVVGAALHNNSGSHGSDIGQFVTRATVMNRAGEIETRQRAEMAFGYRESSLDDLVILSAEFELEPDDPEALTKRMQKQWIAKKALQPMAHQHAGCIFRNPGGTSAGMLIDQAGLKGVRIGGVEVCDRHANFFVADADAKTADVLRLIELVKTTVLERTGVELKPQIEIW